MMYPRHHTRAFTLVETLVAITILTLAILAPFDAVERVVNASRLAKDNLIASSLAQEGLEYVRFIRTSNYLYGRTHGFTAAQLFQGIDNTLSSGRFGQNNCIGSNNLCELDATASTLTAVQKGSCSGSNVNTCDVLYVNTNTGLYTFNTGNAVPSLFKRAFYYTRTLNSNGNYYETVTVQVAWSDHGNQTLTLTENLYDWF